MNLRFPELSLIIWASLIIFWWSSRLTCTREEFYKICFLDNIQSVGTQFNVIFPHKNIGVVQIKKYFSFFGVESFESFDNKMKFFHCWVLVPPIHFSFGFSIFFLLEFARIKVRVGAILSFVTSPRLVVFAFEGFEFPIECVVRKSSIVIEGSQFLMTMCIETFLPVVALFFFLDYSFTNANKF